MRPAVGANPQINLVSNVKLDAAGNTVAQNFGNGVTETRSFHTDGRPANQTDTPAAAPNGDGDVPTLPEWGVILLGSLLLGLSLRRPRQRITRRPG